ncbi:NAD-dependent protein deacylase [Carnobacterium gallinarum]|uniref:NAD-dependent protein deacylase n=1 Tax=Carnobacterium gallinarum TaxID=2749 RepID=UPI0009FEABFE|nr:NAD-dependent protein deacylase [Carnobacterium gallinarum]
MEELDTLQNYMNNSKKIVFFGGAGVSTESGIPDFRSADGIYNQKTGIGYLAEEIISDWFLAEHPALFFDYYFKHLVYPQARPNPAHDYLASLEKSGKNVTVVTQNIDGLHQLAGSQYVLELHGAIHQNHCLICQKDYALEELKLDKDGIPRCTLDNGIVRPNVVLYGEALDETVLTASITAISEADVMIIAGTSLSVYPANGLIHYFKGKKLILINKTSLQQATEADLTIIDAVGETFKQLKV